MSEFSEAVEKELQEANRALEKHFRIYPRGEAAQWYMLSRWRRFVWTVKRQKPRKALKAYPTIESIGEAGTLRLSVFYGIRWDPKAARP